MNYVIEVKKPILLLGLSLFLSGCPEEARQPEIQRENNQQAVATFAGGCFWSLEAPFESLPGVREVICGYAGGKGPRSLYKEVSSGYPDYVETIQVYYNPQRISYRELLETFWMQIDPTDAEGQFSDRGAQYRTAIFYHDSEQKELAEKTRQILEKSGHFKQAIVTEIKPFTSFHAAEEAQQNFYLKHSPFYKVYRKDSGRDKFINQVWGEGRIWEKLEERGKDVQSDQP